MSEILKFAGTISKMGEKLIIILPKEFHKKVEKYIGKQSIVEIKDL